MKKHRLLYPQTLRKHFSKIHVCRWIALCVCFLSIESTGQYPFKFLDVTKEAGLLPSVSSINGHGAGWGDIDGDGWIDLYVGTFHKTGLKSNMMFRNKRGRFSIDKQKPVEVSSRTTGVMFADLDNDGDLDLYIGSMPHKVDKNYPDEIVGNTLFRNDGAGVFTNISKGNGACPEEFGGRSVTVLDYDGDGLLDILAGEDPIKGYNGSKTKSSRLFRNIGGLKFEDVSKIAGVPENIPGYGVAAADVNNDGWPDIFLASNDGGSILFINDGKGKFFEAPNTRAIFAWKNSGESDMVCGVSFGDVNRDGLLDMVLGPHFDRPWTNPQPTRLFLNSSNKEKVSFTEITEAAGLKPIPMKAPHVEIQDMDNDGWPDIYTSLVKFNGGKIYPSIAKNKGVQGGIPQFEDLSMAVNDFPDAADLKMSKGRTAPFYEKMVRERKIIYSAAGPTADYNNDGRLDLFMPNWWAELPSMLLQNQTIGGNWLQVQIRAGEGVNKMGIGARINVYRAGKMGNMTHLLGCREVATGYGYASGQPAIAHFGLGTDTSVDMEIILPHQKGKITKPNIKANQRITITR